MSKCSSFVPFRMINSAEFQSEIEIWREPFAVNGTSLWGLRRDNYGFCISERACACACARYVSSFSRCKRLFGIAAESSVPLTFHSRMRAIGGDGVAEKRFYVYVSGASRRVGSHCIVSYSIPTNPRQHPSRGRCSNI